MTDFLFVHNNFPGQFGFLVEPLQARGGRCAAIASMTGRAPPGVALARWNLSRSNTPGVYPYARRAEADCIRGRAAADCAVMLKGKGFDPDIIVGHPGWGETIFLREIFPRAKQVIYAEYYYRRFGGDVGFDPEFGPVPDDDGYRLHAMNATMTLAYSEADSIVAPTRFQADLLPAGFRGRAHIIHEGVETAIVTPDPDARFLVDDGTVLDASVPVITFINRRFEPLRGFHVFMRALPRILEKVPNAHVLLIGDDEPGGYGPAAPSGTTWKAALLAEIGDRLKPDRVHFTGRLTHERMRAALAISAAHVYLTYPFVLSWSLLEAMASECLVIGSDTAPVRDFITHQQNGILVDFFDGSGLVDAVVAACKNPIEFVPLRQAARRTIVDKFDRRQVCLPAWLRLLDAL